MNQIMQSLLITAIGMGLVFILIILLWGFMGGLVSTTNRWDFMESAEKGADAAANKTEEAAPAATTNKSGIIAVAVAFALAAGQKVFRLPTNTQPSETSSWQAVTRANTLAQISAIFNRKPRG